MSGPVFGRTSVCNSTPFTNLLIEKPGSFRRNDCGTDSEATVATLTIPAGTYGGETADQLQSRIYAALKAMDTQAYANQYGSCLTNPANYTYAVPANHFHCRSNLPARIGIETWHAHYMGNAWTMQERGTAYVFPMGSNDLDFPISVPREEWRLFTYGTPNTQGRLRLYKNGVLYRETTFSYGLDGFDYHNLLFHEFTGNSLLIVSGDRLYLQLTDL